MKKLIATVALAMSLMSSSRGDAIDWYNTVILLDSSGATATAGWIVQMYVDGGNNSIDGFLAGTAIPTGDDTFIARSTFLPAGGFFFTSFDPLTVPTVPDGTKIYSVLFNNASIGLATEYAIIDSALHTVADSSPPASNDQYDTGGTTGGFVGSGGDWQVIPEPSTMVLAGIGGLLVIVRRMRKA